MLITSSQILCDKYDVLPCPLFPYFSIRVGKNGSHLVRSSIISRKFPLWHDPITLSYPRKAKSCVLGKTVTLTIHRSISCQYLLSSSVACTNWQSSLNDILLRTPVSAKASQCDCDLLYLLFF